MMMNMIFDRINFGNKLSVVKIRIYMSRCSHEVKNNGWRSLACLFTSEIITDIVIVHIYTTGEGHKVVLDVRVIKLNKNKK